MSFAPGPLLKAGAGFHLKGITSETCDVGSACLGSEEGDTRMEMFAVNGSCRPECLNCCCKNKVWKASKEHTAKHRLTSFFFVLFCFVEVA